MADQWIDGDGTVRLTGTLKGGSAPTLAAVLAAGHIATPAQSAVFQGGGLVQTTIGNSSGIVLAGGALVNGGLVLVAGARSLSISGREISLPYNAAPADAALDNGNFSFWLDATPGAAKLMVKAKDSAGSVVTAAITLA